MPECIVCRGYYDSGTVCPRCQSDNALWMAWQENEPVEQGGLRGLLFFTEQYFHLPLLVAFTALAFGLMGIAGIWQMIRLPICVLIVMTTALVNLAIIYWAYDSRHRARENELLAQFRATIRKKGPWVRLSLQLQTILIPTVILSSILLLILALMKSDLLRALLQWLLFEPTYVVLEPGQASQLAEFREKATRALPIILLIGYVSGSLALTYFTSRLLSQQYASRMNEALPQPIFLQGALLAKVVQEEAQRRLRQAGRSSPVRQPPYLSTESPQEDALALEGETMLKSDEWSWEDLERTSDGGIRLVAQAECADSRVEESITGHRTKFPEFVSYTIEADRWGRIKRITRGERRSQY